MDMHYEDQIINDNIDSENGFDSEDPNQFSNQDMQKEVQYDRKGGYDHKLVLSIEKTPSQNIQVKMTPKKRGRNPKGV